MAVVVSMYVVRPEIFFRSVWEEQHRVELARVPAVGEFIDMHSQSDRTNDDWYKVTRVVHYASNSDYAANIFVKAVNYHEAFPAHEEDEARVEGELRIIESKS